MTVDVRALSHILKHGEDYQKPEPLRYHLSKILGAGRARCFIVVFVSHLTFRLGLLLVEGRAISGLPNIQ